MENNILISVEWYPNFNTTPISRNFLVSINPSVETGSNFNTIDTSIQLTVLYNQDYNITITANNCVGNQSRIFSFNTL